jgi:hypothetical protein
MIVSKEHIIVRSGSNLFFDEKETYSARIQEFRLMFSRNLLQKEGDIRDSLTVIRSSFDIMKPNERIEVIQALFPAIEGVNKEMNEEQIAPYVACILDYIADNFALICSDNPIVDCVDIALNMRLSKKTFFGKELDAKQQEKLRDFHALLLDAYANVIQLELFNSNFNKIFPPKSNILDNFLKGFLPSKYYEISPVVKLLWDSVKRKAGTPFHSLLSDELFKFKQVVEVAPDPDTSDSSTLVPVSASDSDVAPDSDTSDSSSSTLVPASTSDSDVAPDPDTSDSSTPVPAFTLDLEAVPAPVASVQNEDIIEDTETKAKAKEVIASVMQDAMSNANPTKESRAFWETSQICAKSLIKKESQEGEDLFLQLFNVYSRGDYGEYKGINLSNIDLISHNGLLSIINFVEKYLGVPGFSSDMSNREFFVSCVGAISKAFPEENKDAFRRSGEIEILFGLQNSDNKYRRVLLTISPEISRLRKVTLYDTYCSVDLIKNEYICSWGQACFSIAWRLLHSRVVCQYRGGGNYRKMALELSIQRFMETSLAPRWSDHIALAAILREMRDQLLQDGKIECISSAKVFQQEDLFDQSIVNEIQDEGVKGCLLAKKCFPFSISEEKNRQRLDLLSSTVCSMKLDSSSFCSDMKKIGDMCLTILQHNSDPHNFDPHNSDLHNSDQNLFMKYFVKKAKDEGIMSEEDLAGHLYYKTSYEYILTGCASCHLEKLKESMVYCIRYIRGADLFESIHLKEMGNLSLEEWILPRR